jgi:transcriptional regulator with XRE-family HTH domain
MSTFATKLDELLRHYDMNKSQLARRSGVAVSTVHRWFTRGSVPDYGTIIKVAEVLNVNPRYLIGEVDDPAPEMVNVYEIENESVLDDELVRTIKSLTPAQVQRVRDFLAGLKG